MPFKVEDFVKLRPVLYHLTARANVDRIARDGRLDAASVLMRSGGRTELLREKRRESVMLAVNGEHVHIRDQQPLFAGNVHFAAGWGLGDLVAYLNDHVFFWPGNENGPVVHGQRHFSRYKRKDAVVMRFDTREVFALNADVHPLFCRFNSGSPRCSSGSKSVRGPQTFACAQDFSGTPGSVVEVTFRMSVRLPAKIMGMTTPAEWL